MSVLTDPRRFGKSLLASTLKSYFLGERELFAGLQIDALEKEWVAHPVLHFDMSTAKHQDRAELELELNAKLAEYEKVYGREVLDVKVNQRLQGLVRHAFEQTGRQVVVLIDEYDAPLLDVVHESGNLPQMRHVMRNFYSPLKACDPYLRFVFFTGITKFSQLSVFSELNNITNISMDEHYAGICGITKEELVGQMAPDVAGLAARYGKSDEEMLGKLADFYDGYHFTWPSPDVFNPFSVIKAMALGRVSDYWFESGTPTYIIEMLGKFNALPSSIGGESATVSSFDVPLEQASDYRPLLYQAGYLTIKHYNPITGLYTLDIPNAEVRTGMMRSLLPAYLPQARLSDGKTTV